MSSSFSCMITDRALTKYEQLAVGATTMGAFRPMFRPAQASFENRELVVRADTDIIAGNFAVIAAKMQIKEIEEVSISPIPKSELVRTAFVSSLIVGVGFSLAIIVLAAFNSGGLGNLDLDAARFGLGLLGGQVLGFLFSFLPNFVKFRGDIFKILLVTPDKKAMMLIVKGEDKESALRAFKIQGLKISEIE